MIRITTGICKNKKLKAPNVEGFRAVQEKAKLAVFSILGDKIENARCLDLFSGSGNLGIEALSRGAEFCTFVDESSVSTQTIQENLNNCGIWDKAEVIRKEAVKYAANTGDKFDIIFLDPFYNDTSHVFLLENLADILEREGCIVFFHGNTTKIENLIKKTDLAIQTQRKFGASVFTILEKNEKIDKSQ